MNARPALELLAAGQAVTAVELVEQHGLGPGPGVGAQVGPAQVVDQRRQQRTDIPTSAAPSSRSGSPSGWP